MTSFERTNSIIIISLKKKKIMKKLLLATLLITGTIFAFGQSTQIQIVNTSGCPVMFKLNLSNPSNPCVAAYSSTIISIPAGAAPIIYNFTNYPGSTATSTQFFLSADVYTGPTTCTPVGTKYIGRTTCGFNGQSDITTVILSGGVCTACVNPNVHLVWNANSGPLATLAFN